MSAGVAGCCAKSTVAPFDRVKILLQAHHAHYRHLGKCSSKCMVSKNRQNVYCRDLINQVSYPHSLMDLIDYEL